VHFPTDIPGGWFFASLVLLAFYYIEKPAAVFFHEKGKRSQLICAAAMTFFMNALYPGDISLSALLLGFTAGYSIMINNYPFSASGLMSGKRPGLPLLALRFALGAIGAAVIFFGLRFIIPGEGSIFYMISALEPYYNLGVFVRYGMVGLWISVGAPRFFMNFNLAENKGPEENTGTTESGQQLPEEKE
jgi:hypothetical protein